MGGFDCDGVVRESFGGAIGYPVVRLALCTYHWSTGSAYSKISIRDGRPGKSW